MTKLVEMTVDFCYTEDNGIKGWRGATNTRQRGTYLKGQEMRPQSTRVPRVCEWCGVGFSVQPARFKLGYGRFCSRPCADASRPSLADRFWSKVDRSGECWVWVGRLTPCGYGSFAFAPSQHRRAHRVAWELTNGSIPDGLFVLHNCPGGDNKACVNPTHLWLGTTQDNMADAVRKRQLAYGDRNPSRLYPERQARGERHGSRTHPEALPRGSQHPNSRLNEDQVRSIRVACADGASHKHLAAQYGVNACTIDRIARGLAWRHIREEAQ